MIIKNGLVFNENNTFEKKDIYIENGIIVNNIQEVIDKTEIDAKDCYVIPGLIDTHIHGATGHDFCDKDVKGLLQIAKYLKSNGITAFCPTSMTLKKEVLKEIFNTATTYLPKDCANIVGIHMEGPFLSSEKKGAQDAKFIVNPQANMFKELNKACNNMIKIVTMAPECEGGLDFIKEMSDNVNISIGHTIANYETAQQAFNLGATRVTHLFNAMPAFTHRDPGVVGAALDNDNVFVEVICDGIHIHSSMIRAIFKMFTDERVVLISDGMMATGMENGTYELGGQKVIMQDRKAVLSDGTIAGSATNLFDCMRKAVSFGIPLESAIKACTVTPAKSINIFDKMGSISVGKVANIVIMDKNLNIKQVI
ncbi:N-acetylglucosamine-6-phosphate deacetylase [[Clostridium] colinum]|uniref:N-acetylglucosamine-6-phosphate deacetylase n=1 Tax=[Clostridium] colinum TaxID=36835 RepID=UPI002024415F|nr:N-acetylglucosamine-6-phosphate deacetylase [[Clostridium] colinum]